MHMESVVRAHDLLSNARGQSSLTLGALGSRRGIVTALDSISRKVSDIKSVLAESGAITPELADDIGLDAIVLKKSRGVVPSREEILKHLVRDFFRNFFHGVNSVPDRVAITLVGGVSNFVL